MWSWEKLKGNNPEPHPLSCLYSHDGWYVMQFTGLHDKNGKEIYEGDILRIEHPYKDREYIGEVVYEYYMFMVNGFYFTHYDNPSDAFEEMKYVEVIGNIYENPELLKVY
jgi:uncharacterized phage protein (TIGR01671 family)